MKTLGSVFWLLVLGAFALIIIGQLGLLKGKAPGNLGVKDGRLKPPSKTPNSVSSQAGLYPDHPQKDYAAIKPIEFTGDGEKTIEKIAILLEKRDRVVLVKREQDYLYAQCSTSILKFTDDIEFWLDKTAHVIHVRSSSRLGRKDFEVNRKRVESIRAELNALPS